MKQRRVTPPSLNAFVIIGIALVLAAHVFIHVECGLLAVVAHDCQRVFRL